MAKQVYDYGGVKVEVKEKKGVTVGRVIACIVTAVVLGAGAVCAGFASRNDEGEWFRNKNLSTWHWADKAPQGEEDGEQGGGNVKPGENNAAAVGGSDISEVKNNGVNVLKAVLPRSAYAAMGVSEQAESAYTLTAEVSPDYATDKSLDWSNLAWKNPNSEWATGKDVNDYVTVTPSTNGEQAVLACLQDFGEPLILTVSSVSNPEVCATCFINYYQRIKSCNFAFFYDGVEVAASESNGVYKVDYTGAEKDYTVELRPVYSDYTLTDTYTTTTSGALSSTFGYSATAQLNTLSIKAGMSEGEEPMSSALNTWCSAMHSFYSMKNPSNVEGANRGIEYYLGCPGFTSADYQHPRYKWYSAAISAYNNGGSYNSKFITSSYDGSVGAQMDKYSPAPYNYYGAQIATYNDFVSAVQACNNSGVGVIEYTITINGGHSNYSTVLKLSYNNEFKTNVQDIQLSDTNIAF